MCMFSLLLCCGVLGSAITDGVTFIFMFLLSFFWIFFYWSCSPRRWCSFFLLLNVSFCWAGIVFRLISGWIFDCSGQWKAYWMLTMAWMDSPCSGLCNALGFLQIDRAQVILCGSAVNGRILLHWLKEWTQIKLWAAIIICQPCSANEIRAFACESIYSLLHCLTIYNTSIAST